MPFSVDRIDNEQAHVSGNVRIASLRCSTHVLQATIHNADMRPVTAMKLRLQANPSLCSRSCPAQNVLVRSLHSVLYSGQVKAKCGTHGGW
jgi:hypothetical protein